MIYSKLKNKQINFINQISREIKFLYKKKSISKAKSEDMMIFFLKKHLTFKR